MTLGELERMSRRHKRTPQLPRADIETLWGCGHYDGVGSGIVAYRGELHGAVALSDVMKFKGHTRRFFVVTLSPELRAREQLAHDEESPLYDYRRALWTDGEVLGWFEGWK